MWFQRSVFYHIYPLGLCGAPRENDGKLVNRIGCLEGWSGHLKSLGIGAVYFGPLFESDSHGYDTRDYTKLDCRLGVNEDFRHVCESYHDAGIRIVLDGVFNHVGRGFWAFQDVLKNKESSAYKDWFFIDFGRNNGYNDGLWYEGWEGHYELVKLNLRNDAVVTHLFSCVRGWVEEFGIDGLRLDVAYMLDQNFIRRLNRFTRELKSDFFLLGEMIHGDYKRILEPEMLDSCTNYECYKGIFSSLNTMNLYEIGYSLNRQFGPEHWTLYKGMHLVCFLDNHDVSRIASSLANEKHLAPAYGLLFGMPGIPCLYYGSEWGEKGKKEAGDDGLRPAFAEPRQTALTKMLSRMARLHGELEPLWCGDYHQLAQTNRQLVFSREAGGKRVIVAINADDAPSAISFADMPVKAIEMISGEAASLSGKLLLPPCSAGFWVEDTAEYRALLAALQTPGEEAPVLSEKVSAVTAEQDIIRTQTAPEQKLHLELSRLGARVLVRDFEACYDFYTEKLGLLPHWGDKNGPFASFTASPGGEVCFSMFRADHMGMFKGYTPPNGTGRSDQVTYVMPTTQIDEDYRILRERGVEFLGEPQSIPEWYMRCTYFRDPDGNLFELSGAL